MVTALDLFVRILAHSTPELSPSFAASKNFIATCSEKWTQSRYWRRHGHRHPTICLRSGDRTATTGGSGSGLEITTEMHLMQKLMKTKGRVVALGDCPSHFLTVIQVRGAIFNIVQCNFQPHQ